MKIRCLLVISIFAMALYGDVMYEMATSTGDAIGMGKSETTIRTFIKQDYSRTEITVQSELTGPIANTYIVRLDKKEIWILDLENKEYMIVAIDTGAKSESAVRNMDTTAVIPEINIQSTDEKKTILEVECQKYIVTMNISSPEKGATLTQTMWVSKDVPGYEEISGFNKRLTELAGGASQQSIGGIDKKTFQEFQEKIAGIDGFPLEIEMDFSMPGEDLSIELETRSEVTKVSIVPISDRVFEIPEGYVQKKD